MISWDGSFFLLFPSVAVICKWQCSVRFDSRINASGKSKCRNGKSSNFLNCNRMPRHDAFGAFSNAKMDWFGSKKKFNGSFALPNAKVNLCRSMQEVHSAHLRLDLDGPRLNYMLISYFRTRRPLRPRAMSERLVLHSLPAIRSNGETIFCSICWHAWWYVVCELGSVCLRFD